MLTTLPKAIERYRRLYPRVELRLRELVTAEQMPSLLDGSLDLGFLRDGEPRDGLSIESILRETIHCGTPGRIVAPPASLWRAARGGWGPLLSIGLSPVARQKGSGQMLCRKLHSGQP
jgi:DNA-binding transcriptional LysR family regulator